MGLKSSNKISANEYELEIEISAEIFNKEIDKVYKKDIKKISVPGFRKGKAPRAFVEKYYGEQIFHEDAIKNLYPQAIEEAVDELGIDLVEVNKLDIVTSSKTEGLVFKVNVAVEPEVKIEGYKGIEVEKFSSDVTEEDLEKELEEVRVRNSRLVTVEDKPAKIGDVVVIDFEGFINGEPFEGGKAENFSLELGKNQFIKGFEEQIVGHNTNEEFEINVKFPEDYHHKDYAGKDAVFKIKLHEIKERELPDLDDEFVKDISEFDTLNEYKEDLKKNLKKKKEEQNEADRDNKISEKLAELVEADIPEAMINRRIEELVKDFSYRLQAQGINMGDYNKITGSNPEKIKEQFRPQAETQVKLNLALKKIAEIENISLNEEEIEKEYKKIADNYKMEPEKIKAIVPKKEIEKDLKSQKTMEIVKNNLAII